jgi:F0F1-type ATP synthase assembly protein I
LHHFLLSFILGESPDGFVFVDNKDNQKSNSGGAWWAPAMQIFSDVSTWIVVPIVCALIFGKMLDTHFGTAPVIFLSLAGFAFLITCFGMYRVVKNYMKKVTPDVKSGPRPESVGEDNKK